MSDHTQAAAVGVAPVELSPYLHIDPEHVYDPLSDTALTPEQPGFDLLQQLGQDPGRITGLGATDREMLRGRGWLLDGMRDHSRRFYLKYVSLEAHTICNQACVFCPVSAHPREPYFMPSALYADITHQLAEYRETIDGISLINYNEPTVDRRLGDQIRLLREHGLPPAVLSNGTGMTPKLVDQVMELGGLRYFSVNLSTLDRERYRRDRGRDHLELVLRNLQYLQDLELAPLMEIVVLGRGDDLHRRDYDEICARFQGTRFQVRFYRAMDRAGAVAFGLSPTASRRRLCGCEQTGSRPLQWLHITPQGKCLLCCQDYHEQYVVGDLTEETVAQVLRGDRMARYRRWAYGVEEAPEDFICRRCIYARTRSRG